MLKGKVYLLLENTSKGVVVASHRTRPPDWQARSGVWVVLNLAVPESVFAFYQAALELPENDTSSVIQIFPETQSG